MKRWIGGAVAVAAVSVFVYSQQNPSQRPAPSAPSSRIAVRITFGDKQERETDYSGSLTVSGGRVAELIPWRFFGDDQIQGETGWKLTTRRANYENQPDRPVLMSVPAAQNIVPKGVTAILDAPPTVSATIATARGTYIFRLDALKQGRPVTFEDDDVTVQAVPAPARVSAPRTAPNAVSENDYPSLTTATDGSVWIAWQLYQDGGDRVLVAHSTAQGWSAPEPLTAPGQDVFHTAIAQDLRGHIWVVWSEREGENWNLMARSHDGRGWSATRKLTNANGPNFFHKLVRDRAGNLHLVWIAHISTESHVMWSKLEGDGWTPAQEISGASAWMPDAATDSQGNLYVAWDSYRTGNYDIFLRRIAADGSLGPIQQVTESQRFQAHASLAVDRADRVWLAWDESGANWGKDWANGDPWRGSTLYANRRPRVAVLENGRWSQPAADPLAAVPERYRRYVESPRLTADGTGRIWMALDLRVSTAFNRADQWASGGRWETFLSAYEGDHWRPCAPLPLSSTRPDGLVTLAGTPTGLQATWTNDNRPLPGAGTPAAASQTERRHNDIMFTRFDADGPSSPSSFEPFGETTETPAAIHPHESADVQRIRDYRTRASGGELRILRGDFHRHTEISPDGAGDGSLEDYFRYMIDAASMDTGVVTDHNAGPDEYTWWRTEKAHDLFHIPGGYTPLFGYERSVPYPNGHRNVVFAERGVKVLPISAQENQGAINSGSVLYPYLKQNRGICMLHSLATGQGSDYRDNDPEVEPLVEIYQGYHANYEYEGAPRAESSSYQVEVHNGYRPAGFYWNALAKGLKLGTESSSDHISTHTSYTMIYTPSSNRRDLVESMRKRHAYGATDNIVLDVRARDRQGHEGFMGDALTLAFSPSLHVKVLGTAAIESVEIIKDGKFVYKIEPNATTAEFDYTDTAAASGESWYYVRVMQADRNMAWSSPIWITRQQ